MNIIICIFAIFGLSFFIINSDGPWGIMNWMRNKLMRNKYCGVFFYKLLSCFFCTGCHCGWIIYLLSHQYYSWQFIILYSFAGGAISLLIDALLSKLHQ